MMSGDNLNFKILNFEFGRVIESNNNFFYWQSERE